MKLYINDTLILIKDDPFRIITDYGKSRQMHLGEDEFVRVITADSLLRKPIYKIPPLSI